MGVERDLEQLETAELDALERRIAEERSRREQYAKDQAQDNLVARAYHSQVVPDKVDGIPVWIKPFAKIAAYPSGYVVHHAGEAWQNDRDEVNTTEPGAEDSTWTRAGSVVVD